MTSQLKELDEFFTNNKQKRAFIVGNTYENHNTLTPLVNVDKDLDDVESSLNDCGFQCVVEKSVDNIGKTFNSYVNKIGLDVTHLEFVFYFSGHAGTNDKHLELCGEKRNTLLKEIVDMLEKKEKEIRENISNRLKDELKQKIECDIREKQKQISRKEIEFKGLDINDHKTKRSIAQEINKETKQINLMNNSLSQLNEDCANYGPNLFKIEFKKIFILDCCRKELNSVKDFITTQKYEDDNFGGKNTAFLYACVPGDVALIYAKKNENNISRLGSSLLTRCFLQRIENDRIKCSEKIIEQGRSLAEIAKVIQFEMVQMCTTPFFTDTPDNAHQPKFASLENEREIKRNRDQLIGVGLNTKEKCRTILDKNMSLLRGDITVGDFVFYDYKFLQNKVNN